VVVAAAEAATTTDGIARDRTATRTPPDDVYDVFSTPARPIASSTVPLSTRRR